MLPQVLSTARPCLQFFIAAITLAPLTAMAIEPSTPIAPGGFIESSAYAPSRSTLNENQLLNIIPERGKFTFPAPYNTDAIRLTNASDCNGADCVDYIGYSYWRNMNNHVGFDSMLIFVGLNRGKGGTGPALLEYNKVTDEINNLGPLFSSNDYHSYGSGEGWYFSATMPTALYITEGSKILRYDVITKEFETVLDVTSKLGANHTLWQTHSSNDDRVHSSTLKKNGQDLGCIAYVEDTDQFYFYEKNGYFDECQIDRSGRWLIIKEGSDGLHNRIVDLVTQDQRVLLDPDGAVGHSDVGYGYMIGADNWAADANTQKVWDFEQSNLTGTTTYSNNDWWVEAPAHISHTNARADIPMEEQYACASSVNTANSLHANEIICFRMDSSGDTLVVAPVMTSLEASGGGRDVYAQAPKGNLDITGEYFIWTSNMGGDRQDVFLVKVPGHLLTDRQPAALGGQSELVYPDPEPVTTQDPISTEEPDQVDEADSNEPESETGSESLVWIEPINPSEHAIVWTDAVNMSGVGPLLVKVNGCDGCADAGAASQQQLTSGNGFFEFTASEANTTLVAGLTSKHSGTTSTEIDYGLTLQNNMVEVRENDQYKFDTVFIVGDIFRIQVKDGQVSYLKNGDIFYVSEKAPTYPLRADTAFFSANASIANAILFAGEIADDSSNPDSEESSLVAEVEETVTPAADPVGEQLGDPDDVIWTVPANVTITDTTLFKQWGCDGCADAGAASQQIIDSANGYFEFTTTDSNLALVAGLTDDHTGTSNLGIDYGISLGGGYAEVRENGVYRSDIKFTAGDVFRVELIDGVVNYLKNGEIFYVSTKAPSFPLRADTAFLSKYSSIKDALMVSGRVEDTTEAEPADVAADQADTAAETGDSEAAVAESVVWGDFNNAALITGALKKSGGCNGCADSGAVSQQQIATDNGFFQFTATRTYPVTWVGLADSHTSDNGSDLNYGFRLSKGDAEVREDGVLKTTVKFRRGDIFRIDAVNDQVSYSINGEVIYTSSKSVTGTLRADASLINRNSEVANAMIVRK